MCVYINVTHCRVNVLPLLKEYMLRFPFFFSLPNPAEGMLTLLKRLFGVKGHDCVLSCLAFMDLFCEGWLWYVLCVVYNFSRLRLFCTFISYIDTSEVER